MSPLTKARLKFASVNVPVKLEISKLINAVLPLLSLITNSSPPPKLALALAGLIYVSAEAVKTLTVALAVPITVRALATIAAKGSCILYFMFFIYVILVVYSVKATYP